MKKLIVAAAVAALSVPFAPAALARDGDYGRRYDRGHDHHHREERYVVHYRLAGDRKIHADGHRQAHRIEDALRDLGAEAHIDGSHVVHYHMHGSRRLTMSSHGAAHRLVDQLRSYGFSAHVDHE